MGIVIIGVLLIIIGLGLVSAVVSLVICTTAALIRGQRSKNLLRYAGYGAVFGFFITPWPYVVGRAFGRLLPLPLMVLVMAPSYFIWATLLVGGASWQIHNIWDVTTGFGGWQAPRASVESAIVVSLGLTVLAIACLGACYFSIRGQYRRYKAEKATSQREQYPDLFYLAPFVYMYMWLIGGVFLALLVASYAVSIGVDIQGF